MLSWCLKKNLQIVTTMLDLYVSLRSALLKEPSDNKKKAAATW